MGDIILKDVSKSYQIGEMAIQAVDRVSFTVHMGEFAVVVGDPWHGQGIGSNLLQKCLAIAERRGFHQVHGIVLRENQSMLALGKKLGFQVKPCLDAEEFELVIPLASDVTGHA